MCHSEQVPYCTVLYCNVIMNRCGALLDHPLSPVLYTSYCGFDEESQMMMMCCPEDLVTEPIVIPDIWCDCSNMRLSGLQHTSPVPRTRWEGEADRGQDGVVPEVEG